MDSMYELFAVKENDDEFDEFPDNLLSARSLKKSSTVPYPRNKNNLKLRDGLRPGTTSQSGM